MKTKWMILSLLLVVPLASKPLDRVEPTVIKTISALPIPDGNLRIDGILDDEAWQRVRFVSDFVQRDPDEGAEATEQTEFSVLYDDEYLYVGIMAHDSEPEGIRSILSRRDEETPSPILRFIRDNSLICP